MTKNELKDLVAKRYFLAVVDARKTYKEQSMASYALSKGTILLAEEIAEKSGFWMVLGDLRVEMEKIFADGAVPAIGDYYAIMSSHGLHYDSDGKLLNP